jgi:hypothetical protein
MVRICLLDQRGEIVAVRRDAIASHHITH